MEFLLRHLDSSRDERQKLKFELNIIAVLLTPPSTGGTGKAEVLQNEIPFDPQPDFGCQVRVPNKMAVSRATENVR